MSGFKLFQRRKTRVRHKISRTTDRLRLSVYRTNKHIYAQLIDDAQHRTLAQASTVDEALKAELTKTWDVAAAVKVGELIAKRAIEANVSEVVFDRGGYIFHGRVKALADAARAAGLKF